MRLLPILGAWWYVNHIRALFPDLTPWIGLYQRGFYAEMLCWLEVMAIDLFVISTAANAAHRSAQSAGFVLIESQGTSPEMISGDIYGEGFAAVYASDRYALFSQRLAKLALALLDRKGPPARELLDLACGAGAGTVLFAKAGYVVSGVDNSPTCYRCTEQRAAAAGLSIPLHRQTCAHCSFPDNSTWSPACSTP